MENIAKCEGIRHNLERALDGLELFLDVWGECAFQPRPGSEIQFSSPLNDITTDTDREALERSLEYGRAYLDGMDAVLGLLSNG